MSNVIIKNKCTRVKKINGKTRFFFIAAIGLLVLTLSVMNTVTMLAQQEVNAKGYERRADITEKGRAPGLTSDTANMQVKDRESTTVRQVGSVPKDNGLSAEARSLEPSTTKGVGTPSVMSLDGDFSAQAALTSPFVLQSHNVQNLQAIYEVGFKTTTAGTIKTVEIAFPASPSTPISGARLLEVEGLGAGFLSVSGNTLIYTVTTPVSVPAGTNIRIEIANIFNPLDAANFALVTVSITTKDPGGVIIDGPSSAPAYTIRKIGAAQIADGAITTPKIADGAITRTKPAESYEKRVTVSDSAAGNAAGWDPNGATTTFTIFDTAFSGLDTGFVDVAIIFTGTTNDICDPVVWGSGSFTIDCSLAPPNGSQLHYLITNLPGHLIG